MKKIVEHYLIHQKKISHWMTRKLEYIFIMQRGRGGGGLFKWCLYMKDKRIFSADGGTVNFEEIIGIHTIIWSKSKSNFFKQL